MDKIEEAKYPILFCNPKEFYTIIQRKGIGLEKDRKAQAGTGPALVMVHPLKVNDTEADKKAILTITVN